MMFDVTAKTTGGGKLRKHMENLRRGRPGGPEAIAVGFSGKDIHRGSRLPADLLAKMHEWGTSQGIAETAFFRSAVKDMRAFAKRETAEYARRNVRGVESVFPTNAQAAAVADGFLAILRKSMEEHGVRNTGELIRLARRRVIHAGQRVTLKP